MVRTIDSSNITASSTDSCRVVIMAELDYTEGAVYVHTGVGTIVWNSNSFLGVGGMGTVSPISETADLQANGMTLELSGIDPTIISNAFNYYYQGRTAIVYAGFLDTNYALITNPVVLFNGVMDTQKITLGATAKVELGILDPLADWDRPREHRWNQADQQARYANDKAFQYVEVTVNKQIRWGS